MIRMIPALLFMFLCGALMLVLMNLEQPPQNTQGPLVDTTVPTLPLIDGDSGAASLRLVDYQGKVTVINFFASWCAPCASEMGELVALKKAEPNVRFIGLAWNDGPHNITPWLAKHGDPFDELRYDANGRASIAMGLRGVPETFIIDGKGVIRYQVAGVISPSLRTETLTPLLNQLEGELKHAH